VRKVGHKKEHEYPYNTDPGEVKGRITGASRLQMLTPIRAAGSFMHSVKGHIQLKLG
jgi:hypothetical protein